jgi:[ribosomal protein S5]-alanine N-acetyltransferase
VPKLIIETPRLILREFSPQDVDALARVISDRATMRYYPAPFDHSGVQEWISRNRRRYQRDGHGLWALVLKSTGEMVGDCGLVKQQIDEAEEIEIGYHVRRDLWGQGLASEAAVACRRYGFAHLRVDRLVSLIRPENLPSRRVAVKNGMRIWKETMRMGFLHYVYAISRAEALGRS